MVKIKKFSLSGEQAGDVEISDALCKIEANGQLIKDYIVAIRHNLRQWSACTQDRSQVNHSKKKPHRQKGTGRSRQGSLAAPHMRGGGRPFGPEPKFDQHIRINKKERRLANLAILAERIRDGKLVVVEDIALSRPSTKTMASFMKKAGLKGSTLLLAENPGSEASGRHEVLSMSMRNIPRARFTMLQCANGYELLKSRFIVLTESALQELHGMVKKG